MNRAQSWWINRFLPFQSLVNSSFFLLLRSHSFFFLLLSMLRKLEYYNVFRDFRWRHAYEVMMNDGHGFMYNVIRYCFFLSIESDFLALNTTTLHESFVILFFCFASSTFWADFLHQLLFLILTSIHEFISSWQHRGCQPLALSSLQAVGNNNNNNKNR